VQPGECTGNLLQLQFRFCAARTALAYICVWFCVLCAGKTQLKLSGEFIISTLIEAATNTHTSAHNCTLPLEDNSNKLECSSNNNNKPQSHPPTPCSLSDFPLSLSLESVPGLKRVAPEFAALKAALRQSSRRSQDGKRICCRLTFLLAENVV